MFNQSQRLRLDKDFKPLFASKHSSYDDLMGVRVIKSENNPRFGIIVSNKVSKLAVERNKLKRRTRALLHRFFRASSLKFDLVVIVLPKAKNATFQEFSLSLQQHLRKLQVLSK
ncbi:MAG: ribonuclease P protein component [Candidatus Falkowbacteria bacterium]